MRFAGEEHAERPPVGGVVNENYRRGLVGPMALASADIALERSLNGQCEG